MIKQYLLRTIAILIIATIAGTGLLTLFYCIPDSLITENAELSYRQIEKEDGVGLDEWPLIYSHASWILGLT